MLLTMYYTHEYTTIPRCYHYITTPLDTPGGGTQSGNAVVSMLQGKKLNRVMATEDGCRHRVCLAQGMHTTQQRDAYVEGTKHKLHEPLTVGPTSHHQDDLR